MEGKKRTIDGLGQSQATKISPDAILGALAASSYVPVKTSACWLLADSSMVLLLVFAQHKFPSISLRLLRRLREGD